MAITAAMVKELREKTGLGMMDCKKALAEAGGDMNTAIENLRKKGQATAAKRAGRSATEGKVVTAVEGSTGVIFEVNCETDFVSASDDFVDFTKVLSAALISEKPADLEAALALVIDGKSVADLVTALIGKLGEKIAINSYSLLEAADGEAICSYVHSNSKVGALVKLAGDNVASDEVATLGKDVAMHISASNPVALSRDDVPAELVEKEKEIYIEQIKNEGKPAEMAEKIAIGKLNKFYKLNVLLEQEFIKADKMSVEKVLKDAGNITISAYKSVVLGASEEN